MAVLVAFVAAITCTFGNLAAYGQTNIKRLLAYSTIAQAGYMMMPVAAGLMLAGKNPAAAEGAFAAVPFYIGMYLFMNLGAFAIVALLRNAIRSEEIADYAGLVRTSPGIAICLGTLLFSLVGMPPLAGFAGKLDHFCQPGRRDSLPRRVANDDCPVGHRRIEHGLELVLLFAGREGDGI